MKIAILTNEYPPHVYGGAGVHVEYLSRELAALEGRRHTVNVLCFGEQESRSENLVVKGIKPDIETPYTDPRHLKLYDTLVKDIFLCGMLREADVIHCHTWYTHLAGCLLRQLLDAPLVLTTHSLEPHRPWKKEQLGSGYNVTTWIERTAYQNADAVVAVSQSMKADVRELYAIPEEKIRVIHNGIDLDQYRPKRDHAVLEKYGINPNAPFILFVGRITRQKGIIHLINALKYIQPGVQVVLCAGAPDTEEIGREMKERVQMARSQTPNDIIWISRFLPKEEIINFYTQAELFICPSVYEPFGIINLEAMACGTPVVASAVGGILEVVVHQETGLLIPVEPVSGADFEPRDPERFAKDLASAINTLLRSPEERKRMGLKARERVEEYFSWKSIARQTMSFYREIRRKAGKS